MRSSILALVLALATTACGPGSHPSPPPGGGGTGGGGGSAPGGGGAPGGGSPGDQPSGGSAGGSADGGGSSGAGSGGGAAANAGPVASSDGTVSIERVDADPECDGLLPAQAPDAVSATFSGPAAACGIAGPPDGGGNVPALTNDHLGTGSDWRDWSSFTPGGQLQSTFSVTRPLANGADGVLAQPGGWVSVETTGRPGGFNSVTLEFLSGDGKLRSSERLDGAGITHEWFMAGDPQGGALVTHSWHAAGPCTGDARRYDASGAPRGAPGAIGCFTRALGVSTLGEALVIEQTATGGTLHWIDVDGTPARAPSVDPALPGQPAALAQLAPLLDGSLVMKDYAGSWKRRFPHLADRSEPAPDWLASLPATRFRNTRGNRGYAFFADGPGASADCSQVVELRAPSGRRCGTVTLRNPGGACTPGPADQGWDGTVVEQDARRGCSWRWWPGLLGG